MNIITLSLVLIPLLAGIFSLFKILNAKQSLNDSMYGRPEDSEIQKRFLTLCCLLLSSVLYGAVELYLLMTVYSTELPEKIIVVIMITVVLTALSEIVKGIIISKKIENGALSDGAVYSKTMLAACIGEFIGVLGLLYFFLSTAALW